MISALYSAENEGLVAYHNVLTHFDCSESPCSYLLR